MKNVLIIGGSGTWSGQAYIPSIKKSENCVKLAAIMDIVNPYYSNQTIRHFDYLTDNDVKWIRTTKYCDEDLVRRCIYDNDIDIVIISTPPKLHYEYTLVALKCGVDVICDKPIIATPAQSSSIDSAMINIQKHRTLLQAIEESYNKKALRRCFVLTPLRRKVQDTYTNIYDSVSLVKNEFTQEISNISIIHNDGVYRFCDEVELKCGAHGYSEGFGKLTHTGYHILDVVAGLIEFGIDTKDVECVCKIINCNTVKDMLNSDTNAINKKLLSRKSTNVDISTIAAETEMDITICYTLYHENVKFCNIIVDLIHLGKSNRIQTCYDFDKYNDQGRTNEFTLHVQQGSLFSTQMILNTMSGSNGTVGNGFAFKNYHPKVAKKINQPSTQVLDFAEQSKETTVDVISNFYNMICQNKLEGYYEYTDFSKYALTDELYISALIAKAKSEEFKWQLGKI